MIIAMIPCRLKSVRLPNKPLIKVDGLTVIEHVLNRISLSKRINKIIICTEDIEIYNLYKNSKYQTVLTSNNFKNGTERIAYVAKNIKKAKLIIDIQCDNIFLNPHDLDNLVDYHISNPKFDIVVPHSLINETNNKNIVKLISTFNGKIISMSRHDIPYIFRKGNLILKKHLDFISFKPKALEVFSTSNPQYNESIEGIELLRAIEIGLSLGTIRFKNNFPSINVSKDLVVARKRMPSDKIRKLYK